MHTWVRLNLSPLLGKKEFLMHSVTFKDPIPELETSGENTEYKKLHKYNFCLSLSGATENWDGDMVALLLGDYWPKMNVSTATTQTKWKGVRQKSWEPRVLETESNKGDLLTVSEGQIKQFSQVCVELSPRGDFVGRDTQNNCCSFLSTEREKQVAFQGWVPAFSSHLYHYHSTIS